MSEKIQVLIVEDIAELADISIMALHKEGFETFHVRTGKEALDTLETFKPNLMLLDLGLPDMTGWQVLESMKKQLPEITFPIIVMTAFSDSANKLVGKLQKAVVRYVVKPATPGQIREVAREALQKYAEQNGKAPQPEQAAAPVKQEAVKVEESAKTEETPQPEQATAPVKLEAVNGEASRQTEETPKTETAPKVEQAETIDKGEKDAKAGGD